MEYKDAVLITGVAGFTGTHLLNECIDNESYVLGTDTEKALMAMPYASKRERESDEESDDNDYNGDDDYNDYNGALDKIFQQMDWLLSLDIALQHVCWQAIPSDLRKKETLEAMLEQSLSNGIRVREIYHLAAVFDMNAPRELLFAVNAEGTRNLCEAIKNYEHEARIRTKSIYCSTASIYGHHHDGLITEDIGFENTGDYPESKYNGEEIFNESGLDFITVRPGLKYGRGSVYGAIVLLAAIAQMGILPTVGAGRDKGKYKCTYLHIKNDVAAMMHLMEHSNMFDLRTDSVNAKAYNLADPREISQKELMVLVHKFAHGDGIGQRISRAIQNKIPIPKKVLEIGADMNKWAVDNLDFPSLLEPASTDYFVSHHCFSTQKLAATGFEWPVQSTTQGIIETLEWYKSNHWEGLPDLSWKALAKSLLEGLKTKVYNKLRI